MPATISMITLGVSDLGCSITFYETISFKRVPFDSTAIAFFEAGGPQLALFPRKELAEDAGVSEAGNGFSGVTLSRNFSTSREVDGLLSLAGAAGGELVKSAEPVNWGGYSGYFADPDGHLWEAACGSAEYQAEQQHKSD
jgi:uncharacterized protein